MIGRKGRVKGEKTSLLDGQTRVIHLRIDDAFRSKVVACAKAESFHSIPTFVIHLLAREVEKSEAQTSGRAD